MFIHSSGTIYDAPSLNFHLKAEVVGCFCEHDEKILLLLRSPQSIDSLLWTLPGGKIESESLSNACVREVQEETGIELSEKVLNYIGKVFVRYSHGDFIYHMFKALLPEFPPSILMDLEKHTAYQWIHKKELKTQPDLMPGLAECAERFYLKV